MDNREVTRIQYEYMEKMREVVQKKETELHRPLQYCIKTFGCQMNAKDSEKLSGILEYIGYRETDREEDSDLVLYNTCTVRENANDKVYGHLGFLMDLKRRVRPDLIVVLCGCMMQEPDEIECIRTKYPFVSVVFGTHNIFMLAELLYRYEETGKQVIEVLKDTDLIVEDLPIKPKFSFKAGVNIMYGCNNFCTYCIVPYVRGRERSRKKEDILAEIRNLASNGVKEIMLLGQNVNSYGKTLDTPVSFSELLNETTKIEGIERIRFMTSHPKDLSDELIDVMASSEKICHHFHLPLQSGSDRILTRMNRHYTAESYLNRVEALRKKIPDISITTDIIVGFPGETEEDFEATLDMCKKVRFQSAFTFIYSPRVGTPAADFENTISDAVLKDRFDRLLKLVQKISEEEIRKKEGQVLPVLFEEINRQNPAMITGRLSDNNVVHAEGSLDDIGKIRNVRLDTAKGFYYIGTIL